MPYPLILLHGANGSGETMSPLAKAMRQYVTVETPNAIGHGGRPVPERFMTRQWAEDVIAFMDSHNIAKAFLLGYSFGGYVALYLARHFPERLCGICTLAAKYIYDAHTVSHFTHLTSAWRLSRPGNPRADELSKTHHPQNWITITTHNGYMFKALGDNPAVTDDDLRAISLPALIISGEYDQLVPAAESVSLGRLIRGSTVVMFPGAAHPLGIVPIQEIAPTIKNWMARVEAASAADAKPEAS